MTDGDEIVVPSQKQSSFSNKAAKQDDNAGGTEGGSIEDNDY